MEAGVAGCKTRVGNGENAISPLVVVGPETLVVSAANHSEEFMVLGDSRSGSV